MKLKERLTHSDGMLQPIKGTGLIGSGVGSARWSESMNAQEPESGRAIEDMRELALV